MGDLRIDGAMQRTVNRVGSCWQFRDTRGRVFPDMQKCGNKPSVSTKRKVVESGDYGLVVDYS